MKLWLLRQHIFYFVCAVHIDVSSHRCSRAQVYTNEVNILLHHIQQGRDIVYTSEFDPIQNWSDHSTGQDVVK